MDDEAVGLRHELAGSDVAICDLCGRPVVRDGLSDVPVDRGMGEPVEAIRVCPACGRTAEADELPYDAEIAFTDAQIGQIQLYVRARKEKVLPAGRPDELGPNKTKWAPPAGWPKT